MNKKCIKKIILGTVTFILAAIYFGMTSKSNAANIVETWDVSADDGISNVTATLYDDGKFVIEGTGSIKRYVFSTEDRPYHSKISDIKTLEIKNGVTSIGCQAFWGCSNLTGSLVIPESVISIDAEAFSYCKSLTGELKLPEGLTSIGNYAFSGCSGLTGELKLPEGLTSIKYGVFRGCSSLTGNLIIPKGVTIIQNDAFSGCSGLTGNLKIPEGVTSIGENAFKECSGLTGELKIPEGVTSIGENAFKECSGLTGNLKLPEGLTSIGRSVFSGCSGLTGELKLPESLTNIGNSAFYNCNKLTGNLIIPKGVTSIEDNAFLRCSGLTAITVDANNLYYCSITGVLYNKEKSTLIRFPEGKKQENCVIPEEVITIRKSAFSGCSGLTGELKLPKSLTSIEEYAFYDCRGLTGNLIIPEGVSSIGRGAFHSCSGLTGNLIIPEGVTDIGEDAFFWCNLTNVIPYNEEVKEIELPDIIKRAMMEDDILYSKEGFGLVNCELNADKDKLIINMNNIKDSEATIGIRSGKLNGLTIVFRASGSITYKKSGYWTNNNVVSTLHIAEGERIINNEGKNTYTFEENGEFTFKYLDINNEEKEVVAKVDKIDKTAPTIKSVEGNPTNWTKENVTIVVNAEDRLSEIEWNGYSFDGGETWQKENKKTYTDNTQNIVIKVRDNARNITEYEPISITKIDKEKPIIKSVEGNPTEWTDDKVRLRITSEDKLSGLAENPYSFDGGRTWQRENTKTFTENTNNIVVKVKDKAGNEEEYSPISITKIKKMNVFNYEKIEVDNIKYIERILPNTTIKEFKENIETNGTIKIIKNNQVITNENDLICTGMTISVNWNSNEESYKIIVTGDLTGNGKMGIGDLSKLSRYAAGMDKTLSGAYLRASDVVKDGKYGRISDISKMSRVLAGMDNF